MATPSTGVGRGAGGGQPTKYRASYCRIAQRICRLGGTIWDLALAFNVSESTIKLWMVTHPRFSAAIKVGGRPADKSVEITLFRRATGYSYEAEEVFCSEGEIVRAPVIKHVPPDTRAAIFWLKNRRKDRWRDYKHTELSTPPGKPLEIAPALPVQPALVTALRERLARRALPRPARGRPAGGADSGVGDDDPGQARASDSRGRP